MPKYYNNIMSDGYWENCDMLFFYCYRRNGRGREVRQIPKNIPIRLSCTPTRSINNNFFSYSGYGFFFLITILDNMTMVSERLNIKPTKIAQNIIFRVDLGIPKFDKSSD